VGRIAGHDGIVGDIPGNDTPGTHNGVFADGDTTKEGAAGTDGCSFPDEGGAARPILLCLQGSSHSGRPRVKVVDKGHIVPDKHFFLHGNSLADKGVTGYLAVSAEPGIFLNLHEHSDLCPFTNLAAVMSNLHIRVVALYLLQLARLQVTHRNNLRSGILLKFLTIFDPH
jgi:hypothetical protein